MANTGFGNIFEPNDGRPRKWMQSIARFPPWQARMVCRYIDDHLEGSISIEDLCALVSRSKAHFSRHFKRTFGTSPHAFVIRRRLELAARYMLETDSCLTAIALQCGFADQAHFCRRWRESTRETPAAWRRAHQVFRDAMLKQGNRGPELGPSVCRTH
jgi:AraC family transcriptional regulator